MICFVAISLPCYPATHAVEFSQIPNNNLLAVVAAAVAAAHSAAAATAPDFMALFTF